MQSLLLWIPPKASHFQCIRQSSQAVLDMQRCFDRDPLKQYQDLFKSLMQLSKRLGLLQTCPLAIASHSGSPDGLQQSYPIQGFRAMQQGLCLALE